MRAKIDVKWPKNGMKMEKRLEGGKKHMGGDEKHFGGDEKHF